MKKRTKLLLLGMTAVVGVLIYSESKKQECLLSTIYFKNPTGVTKSSVSKPSSSQDAAKAMIERRRKIVMERRQQKKTTKTDGVKHPQGAPSVSKTSSENTNPI